MTEPIALSMADYGEWTHARTLSQHALQLRAAAALAHNEAIVTMDRRQWKRWFRGELTPWRRPDVRWKHRGPVMWPVLPHAHR